MELWVEPTRLGVVISAASVLTLTASFLLDFPVAAFGAAVGVGARYYVVTTHLVEKSVPVLAR